MITENEQTNQDNNILVELIKNNNNGYEKTIAYKNGIVEFEILKDGNISKETKKIDIINDLKVQLIDAYNIMISIYNEEKNSNYKVSYNNHDFYSLDLYIDIYLIIKHNQIKKLSAFNQYEKYKKEAMKEKQIKDNIRILNKLQKEKNNIDISDIITTDLEDERNIISFKLEKNNNFTLGESRFFSDTIDLPYNIELPDELEVVGQLNLSEISKYDIKGLLPQNGMLYFFQSPLELDDNYYEFGKVIYSDDMNLRRVNIEVTDKNKDMILNLSLKEITNSIEKFSNRYEEENGEITYNSFEGENLNKLYGFYTDCQMNENDIKKVSKKYIVLLQLGSEIYGEGITTFLISEDDLKNKNFESIIYMYSQT